MIEAIIRVASKVPESWRNALPHHLQRWVKRTLQRKQLRQWVTAGRPVPPPHIVKVKRIQQLAQHYNIDRLVETGTYMGDMIDSVAHDFKRIDSIELSDYYYQRAKQIFRKNNTIYLHLGDSSQLLSTLLKKIDKPTIFWLDAHYSGGKTAMTDLETPIIAELTNLFSHSISKHVILIDDARHFTGNNGYPTLKKLKKFIAEQSHYQISIKDDCVCLLPP